MIHRSYLQKRLTKPDGLNRLTADLCSLAEKGYDYCLLETEELTMLKITVAQLEKYCQDAELDFTKAQSGMPGVCVYTVSWKED